MNSSTPTPAENRWTWQLVSWATFAVAYLGCAELGHHLAFDGPGHHDRFSTCWPAAGLFVATLLLFERRVGPVFLSIGFLAEWCVQAFIHRQGMPLAVATSFAHALEAGIGAYLVQRLSSPTFRLRRMEDVFALISGSAVISTAVAAFIGAITLTCLGNAPTFREVWYHWLLSDMLGILLVTPLIIAWLPWNPDLLKCHSSRILEASVLFGGLAILGYLVFFFPPNFARAFILFPILIFVAMRLGLPGATVATAMLGLFAILGTINGTGVFAHDYSSTVLRSQHLQVFLAASSLTTLLFSCSFAERLQAEFATKHHLELLNAVLEGTTDAVFVKDLEGRYLMINKNGAKFLKKSPNQVVGKDDSEMFSPESFASLRANDLAVMHGGTTKTYEEILTVDNVTYTFLSTKGPYYGENHELRGLLGISRDITEYRHAVTRLRESDARFLQMAETIPEFFWLRQNEPFKFLYASPAYTRITGRPVDELYADPFKYLESIHPDDREKMIELSMAPVTAPMEVDCRAIGTQGETRYMRLRYSPVANESGTVDRQAGIAIDVTELTLAEQRLEHVKAGLEKAVEERTRQLTAINGRLVKEMAERNSTEEKLQQQQAQLAHVSRLSTIGEMAAELAHELNQPLSSIANYIYGTLQGLHVGDLVTQELLANLNQLKQESDRATGIMRRVRNFTRRTDPQRVECSLNETVYDVFRLTSAEARHRHLEMEVHLDENLPKIMIDPLQIEQVVVNLVRNAFDALQDSGNDSRLVVVDTLYREGSVEVAVHDNGPGIPADKRERIFEPFFTTKADGLGLGLAISRTIIEAHQGRLWVEPRLPRGTTFRFSIPIVQGPGTCT